MGVKYYPRKSFTKFEDFRRVGQIAAPVFRDKHHVFDADGAEPGIVEAWFDGDNMAFLEQRPGAADARHFMNVKSNPMAGAVKIALHAPIHQAGLVPGFLKSITDALMDPAPSAPSLTLVMASSCASNTV